VKTERNEVRIDTYLWAIRMFKSRSLASDAIKGGKVKLNENKIKASHTVKIGEVYTITISSDHKKIIEVTDITDKRGNFETAKKFYADHSPPMEKVEKQAKAFFTMNIKQEKGSGRPTKKDRRKLKKNGGWF
jgi:ribosome-associated heat shock protein Hsp15